MDKRNINSTMNLIKTVLMPILSALYIMPSYRARNKFEMRIFGHRILSRIPDRFTSLTKYTVRIRVNFQNWIKRAYDWFFSHNYYRFVSNLYSTTTSTEKNYAIVYLHRKSKFVIKKSIVHGIQYIITKNERERRCHWKKYIHQTSAIYSYVDFHIVTIDFRNVYFISENLVSILYTLSIQTKHIDFRVTWPIPNCWDFKCIRFKVFCHTKWFLVNE